MKSIFILKNWKIKNKHDRIKLREIEKRGKPMKCKNCGQELGENVKLCPICGEEQVASTVTRTDEHLVIEQRINNIHSHWDDEEKNKNVEEVYEHQKSRLVAGLLQLFLGGFGLGRFYLGYTGIGIAQLCTLPLFGIGYIWGFIDGILILCRQLDLDGEGIPLKG